MKEKKIYTESEMQELLELCYAGFDGWTSALKGWKKAQMGWVATLLMWLITLLAWWWII